MSKLCLRTFVTRLSWLVTKMPTPTIHTVMLQELTEHHQTSQQQCLQQHIASAVSDISSSETSASDSMSEVSDPVSLMSIDMPDINVSSNISIHSDNPLPTSSSDTDSLFLLLDFEVEYYTNWKQHYQELLYKILTTCVLNPAPPVPKSSQLHLLDHWRIHSSDCFCRKLCVEPQMFDHLVSHIEDHPVFYNDSNNSQLSSYVSSSFMLGIMEMSQMVW